MVVDDNPFIVKLYENFLQTKGIQNILKATNGHEAVNLFENLSEKPNIVMMDYLMPEMNGLESAREILHIDFLELSVLGWSP